MQAGLRKRDCASGTAQAGLLFCARLAFTAAKYGVGVGDPEVLAERERLCDALLGDGRTRTHALARNPKRLLVSHQRR